MSGVTRPRSNLRSVVSTITALGVIVGTVILGQPALAADIPVPPPIGNLQTAFEIDGNRSGQQDWDGVLGSGAYGPYVTAQNHRSTGIIARTLGTEPCEGGDTGADDVFVSGQKLDDEPWQFTTDAPNKKADLCQSGAAWEIVDVNGQQHIILYQFWTRSADGTGDLTVYQEFNGPNPGSLFDDFLIEFNYDSPGSVSVQVLRWNGSSWSPGAAVYQAAVGTNGANGNIGTFGEVAVDLTATGALPETSCTTTTVGRVLSRTGNSQNATMEDVMTPGAGFPISTCADMRVTKTTTGPVPAGLTFPYVIDQADGKAVHDGSLTGTVGDTDGTTAAIHASIASGATHTWQNVIAQPDYRVAELTGSLPPGVSLDTVVCTYPDLFSPGHETKTVTLYQQGAATGATFPVFQTVLGAAAPECVITNRVTSLTLNKVLRNDHGGTANLSDVTLTATPSGGGSAVINGPDPSAGAAGITALVAPGSYRLSETQLPGYAASAWSCTGGSLSGDVVTIVAGTSAVCTITNDDIPAHLTLTKRVLSSFGGTLQPSDFTLTATRAGTTISGVQGAAAITDAEVARGTWTIGEEPRSGYERTDLTCWADPQHTTVLPVTNGQVTLTPGATAYCEQTNRDLPGRLTLIKKVENDNGGSRTAGEWTLTATGPTTPIQGVTGETAVTGRDVIAGSYALSESGPTDYRGAWACEGGTLTRGSVAVANGADVVCTLTNDDIAPKLTLIKTVTNDNGGTRTAAEWTLSASGPTSITGHTGDASVTSAEVSAGAYTLAEHGPSGYAAGAWRCDGGVLQGSTLTLALAQDVTCRINNDDIEPTLTLHKTVINTPEGGGTATVADFPLHAVGAETSLHGVSGTAAVTDVPVPAGTYTLSESALASGYHAGAWQCTEGTLDGGRLTLQPGQNAFCTIVNADVPAKLTLVKVVKNLGDGSGYEADAWTLGARRDANTAISGTTGSAAVTGASVPAGVYRLSETGPDGYSSAWQCTSGLTGADAVTIGVGADVTCTITNTAIAPVLTLRKEVVNDNGGTSIATDWTLSADGPSPIEGATGSTAVTEATVRPGTYQLTETGPSGYAASAWTCEGADVTRPSSIVLELGDRVTCTITNDDIAPRLTLVKHVTNDNGGTDPDTAWTLTATGEATVTGTTGTEATTSVAVPAGTYVLSESGPSGYTASAWACEGGTLTGDRLTLSPGQNAVCEITNDDIAPRLTLVKRVVNLDGGNEPASSWTLTAAGPSTIAGRTGDEAITGADVPAGEYRLAEDGPAGYTASAWDCGPTDVTDMSITLRPGDVVTCVITNDDKPVNLTLTKKSALRTAPPLTPFDYTITVTNVGTRAVDHTEPVVVMDRLPADMTPVTVPSTCTATGQDVRCDVDPTELPPGASVTITLRVMFTDDAKPGVHTNMAWVTTKDDPAPETPECPLTGPLQQGVIATGANPFDNVDCATTTVPTPPTPQPQPPLSLPATGSSGTESWLIALGLGMLVLGVGGALRRRRV